MVSKNLLVTGSKGQLGCDLLLGLAGKFNVTGFDIDEVDIRNGPQVEEFIRSQKPDVVIHTAAYTDVDGCESNPDLAMAVNCGGAENIARACCSIDAKMIFYSTDYVFDGLKDSPYQEDDIPNPKTVYGKSKWDGERAVSRTLENNAILRIAWVYGYYGKNFVKTIIRVGKNQLLARQNGETVTPLRVVDDQIGNPTWTEDITRQTAAVIESDLTGIYHCTSEGESSWYQFARDIFEELQMPVELIPCTTEEYPRPAPRPRHSSLENSALKKIGLNLMPGHKESLQNFLKKYGTRLKNEIQD